MKQKPLVSVLMPAFNAEKYISESIDSILEQSYSNFELIILDDGSTDSTYNIAKKYQRRNAKIRVYRNARNLDIAESRNLLIKKSTADYIAWQDADDISLPRRLELQIKYLLKHPQVGIVGGYIEFFDENNIRSIRKYSETDTELRKKIFRYSPVAQPTAMIRREAIKYAGSYGKNLSPAEDIDMSFRIGTKYKFANIQQVTLRYRNNNHSATYRKLRKIEIVTLKTRLRFMLHSHYKFTIPDVLYNIAQYTSMMLMPSKYRIALFNKIRNQ